ncbi:phosphoglycerate mutase family protein [Lindgomyces ingoldianus]|uniref:Phosphoglycerate mutase family protein n=1 Tax=Lindgomyces ingoldianus TaxID=673940 RepID=A0ACB6QNF2_9PLEO|nr:phosphoglycerate mutase family protein [Lindgomyces ingoldianus]KAF2467676.1 phosphoglycerate mutase family protein [Lindgomyces ingoldianus]
MIEVVYIVRHGYRANWTVNPTTGEYNSTILSETKIPTDPPLSSYGVRQAEELAEHLCNINPPIDVIYSSPFYRCLQTLKPTIEKLFEEGRAGGKIRVERGLGEFYGRAPFAHPSPANTLKLSKFFPNLDLEYESLLTPPPNGEMIRDLHERVANALNLVIASLDSDPAGPKTMLICTHAATMIAIGRALTGNVPDNFNEDDFKCYTASLSTFARRGDAEGVLGNWECVGNAETGYLSGGEERGWKFNGEENFSTDPDPIDERQAPKL